MASAAAARRSTSTTRRIVDALSRRAAPGDPGPGARIRQEQLVQEFRPALRRSGQHCAPSRPAESSHSIPRRGMGATRELHPVPGNPLEVPLRPLPAPDRNLPTPAEGWSVRHQVAHLTWTDRTALSAIEDPATFAALREVRRRARRRRPRRQHERAARNMVLTRS
ncbi:maleylpyruvate isomerase N-terminal domain-containing protein [Kocuria sp. M1R5S2]|uniref:maleylpyruvate isomerase N-terminal domain-containing protein n=1 Tax=Kocuria rhizosphaerae TaxID=3376285 RepID=UPI0037AF59CC